MVKCLHGRSLKVPATARLQEAMWAKNSAVWDQQEMILQRKQGINTSKSLNKSAEERQGLVQCPICLR